MAAKRGRHEIENDIEDNGSLLGDESSSESTESEESEYSGLEEEPDTSSESESESEENEGPGSEEAEEEVDAEEEEEAEDDTNTRSIPTIDEYEDDSSDEEDIRNTIGNIPIEWYNNEDHIGYDVEGRKLIKPVRADALEDFLGREDDPDYYRSVVNKLTGQKVVLGEEDLQLVRRLLKGQTPSTSADPYAPWQEWFSSEVMEHPVTSHPPQKRSFVPSAWERLRVGQLVHAIKMGWLKTSEQRQKEREEKEKAPQFYQLWKDDEEPSILRKHRMHIPAPKTPLPGHAESYNPPAEYLFDKEEEDKWEDTEPEDRRMNFKPQKFSSLRLVPAYQRFINERFERCIDLYMSSRQTVQKVHVKAEDLLPKIPKPHELRPFPRYTQTVLRGHTDMVRTLDITADGECLASGSDDMTVKIWRTTEGRCLKTLQFPDKITCLEWKPSHKNKHFVLAVAAGRDVYIVSPGSNRGETIRDSVQVKKTDKVFQSISEMPEEEEEEDNEDGAKEKKVQVEWYTYPEGSPEYESGLRLRISHPKEVAQVTWHKAGDYFVAVPRGVGPIMFHRLSRKKSRRFFSKVPGLVQCVRFHPTGDKPLFYVLTQKNVRLYDLAQNKILKKLLPTTQWASSLAIHPRAADNLIVGTYEGRLSWFDLDFSTKPYQTLRHHKKAVRQVCFHPRYPLFASASDDRSAIVCHGMVYDDLTMNALIVPVASLKSHDPTRNFGVLDVKFHPIQPWLYTAGSDGTIRLHVE